ncbi:MAG: hypothetical protein ACPG4W_02940 [Flavobacteriales bacterium]
MPNNQVETKAQTWAKHLILLVALCVFHGLFAIYVNHSLEMSFFSKLYMLIGFMSLGIGMYITQQKKSKKNIYIFLVFNILKFIFALAFVYESYFKSENLLSEMGIHTLILLSLSSFIELRVLTPKFTLKS